MASAARAAIKSPTLTKDISAFCTRLGIKKYLPIAVRIVAESFPTAGEVEIHPESDPESGEDWLVLQIAVSGTRTEIRRQYDRYVARKIEQIPWPQRDAIRLLHYRV